MIALAIAIPTLLMIYRQGGLALAVTRSAASYDGAVSRAQSRLDALKDTALVAGDREGDDGDGFRWHVWIAPIATVPKAAARSSTSAYTAGTTLYAVSVAISWREGRSVVSLQTRRLGPAQGERP